MQNCHYSPAQSFVQLYNIAQNMLYIRDICQDATASLFYQFRLALLMLTGLSLQGLKTRDDVGLAKTTETLITIKKDQMKLSILFTFVIFASFNSLSAQVAEDQIRLTINNYFNGTAYNYPEQIQRAFMPGATLYLENREGELMVMTAEDYINGFKKNDPGSFNGRYSKIISIDIEGNLAQVKAEILFPKINKRFIDIFIVKELEEGQWFIISKAANSKLIEEE